MSRLLLILVFAFLFDNLQSISAQGCLGADPFCTGTSYTFNNSTNVADLGSVGCLNSTPNPSWYYMEIDQNGPMGFIISQTSTSGVDLDVDFALWGPYSSLAAGCGNPFPNGTPIDCSYSTAATESVSIPNAQVGQTYILIITNFSNSPGTITFSQTSGSGSADCSFTCGVALTATQSACNNNTYSVNGNLTVTAGPGISVPNTGTVTIANSCGGSQTFNAPFTNIPFSFTGLNANGSSCTITAAFSNFPNCNAVAEYIAPSNCVTPCSITSLTTNQTSCQNNQYNLNGQINFTNPPSSGTLTVTGSCGGTQTFSAPFISPLNYSFANLIANGAACSVTATFSDLASCTSTSNYLAPAGCGCTAEVGTYVSSLTGNTNSQNMLCFGDNLNIVSNNNWTPPAEIIGATDPNSPNYDPNAPTYDPGIVWLIYSCPPSVSLNPAQSAATGLEINDDPCLMGVVSNSSNLSDVNNLSLLNNFPPGTFSNNTVYFVPLTMYSIQDGLYSYVTVPDLDCFELGPTFAIQYLPEVTYNQTQNCPNGTVSAIVSGGAAGLNGTNFTIVPGSLSPTTATVLNSNTTNNGTITIGNLQTGPYSFIIEDANNCPVTVQGNFIGPENADFIYLDNLFCVTDNDPSPIINGTPGGSFSSSLGLSLNSITGSIDLSNSSAGLYTITYTSPSNTCPGVETFPITIENLPIVNAGPDQTICLGSSIILSGQGASYYNWNNGLTNGVSYLPGVGQTEFIVQGFTNAGCMATDTVIINTEEDCIPETELIFWVPNTFTPDNDQFNQNWEVIFFSGYDIYSFELYIYNRWGELVWENHDVNVGWDGTYFNGRKCPDGVYTWKIKFKRLQNDEKQTAVGHVTLIR